MKKKYSSLLICMITIFFLSQFFIYTEEIIKAFFDATKLWFYNLVPTIFPFFIISDILNNYHLIDYISKIFGKVISVLFKLPKECAYPFFMSMMSGFPGNSKFVKELLDDKIICNKQASKLLTFTHFSNPLFIISTIGITFLGNKKIGIIILICHFLTSVIVGLLFRNIYFLKENKIKQKERITLSFIPLLKSSITNTVNTLFLIYGIIIFFFILTTIINLNFNFTPFNQTILNGLLEMTSGLKYVSEINYSITVKACLSTFFISFGGFAIHMQIMSILSDYKINYFIYFLSRILQASIATILVYIILTYH